MRDFSNYYLDIKKNYNAATAEAVESFYSIYTDRL